MMPVESGLDKKYTGKEQINEADYMLYVIKNHSELGNRWLTEQWCNGNKESLREYVERHLAANENVVKSSDIKENIYSYKPDAPNRSVSKHNDILPKDISDALKQLSNDIKAGITNPETTQRLCDVLYKGHSGGNRSRMKTRRRRR
jgi:hypothetical protein